MLSILKKLLPALFFVCALIALPVIYLPLKSHLHVALLAIGFMVLITGLLWKARVNRHFIYKAIVTSLLLFVVLLMYNRMEKKLTGKGIKPGIFFTNFTCDSARIVDQYVAADEVGLNYYERPLPWLAHYNRTINAQGFIAPFNYDFAAINAFREQGKRIVFIIGDSFVEGVSEHYDSVFVERLRKSIPTGQFSPSELEEPTRSTTPSLQNRMSLRSNPNW